MSNLTFHAHNPYCLRCQGGGWEETRKPLNPCNYDPCPKCGPTAMLTVSKVEDLAWLTELAANTHYSPEKDNWYSFIGHPGKAWMEITTRLLRFTGEFDLVAALSGADPECVMCSGSGVADCSCRKHDLTGVDAVVLAQGACSMDCRYLTTKLLTGDWPEDCDCGIAANLAAAREALTERGVKVVV